MPTTNTRLQKKVDQQGEAISKLLARISAMADEVASLQNEVRRFKNNVAEDVKYLTERVDGQ